jgi:hypothetical protein
VSNNSSQPDNPVVNALIGLASIGIVFLVLNGILWGCQEVTSGNSKAEFMEKKEKLDALNSEVENCQARLDSYKSMAVGNALDSENYASYKSDLARCNDLVVQYNQLVPAVNELNRRANNKIYLLPIPIPRRAAQTAN